MASDETDTALVIRALDAARQGDREAFGVEWRRATDAEKWRLRAHARIDTIMRAQSRANSTTNTPTNTPPAPASATVPHG